MIQKHISVFICFSSFYHIFWNVSHKLKISNRNDRKSTKPLKIIELHCEIHSSFWISSGKNWFWRESTKPLKNIECFYLFSSFSTYLRNVSHKLKISNRNDRESTKPLKNHRIVSGYTLQPWKVILKHISVLFCFSSFRSYLLKC